MQGSGEQMEEGEDKEWKELGIDYCLTSVNASFVLILNRLMPRVCRIMEYFKLITFGITQRIRFQSEIFSIQISRNGKKKKIRSELPTVFPFFLTSER